MKNTIIYLLITFCSLITYAQNVGIGTTAPVARLHIADSSVLFSAVGIVPADAGNTPQQGAGRRMMWYADKAAFRAGYASNDEWDRVNIGRYSFAAGYGVKASGDWSFAAGLNNIAGGQSSIAIGVNAQANPNFSIAIGTAVFATGAGATALGYGNTAQGINSLALGLNNYSKSFGGTVLGQYNDVNDNPNSNVASSLDRIFQVGNGFYDEFIDDEVRKNAITVIRNGNTGIGTVTPQARLHVSDSNVVFTGSTTIPASTTFDPPVQGPGTRMMWYPQKAAFRAGLVDGPYWDKDSIGRFSFATGWNSKAKGEFSFASGAVTIASGMYSTSMGQGTIASGGLSISLGFATMASGESSTSMGRQTIASGNNSASMGYQTNAIGDASTSMGHQTNASGYASISMGYQTTASGYSSTSMGRANNASGNYSTCIGLSNSSKAYGSFTAGLNNNTQDNPDPDLAVATDRIFQIGNGSSSIARSNALTVLRNGKVGIGTTNPATTLDIAGGNNWDLTNSEGDFRIGNGSYRIKMGIATDGNGAGEATIRSAGGVERLNLGANNTNLLSLDGASGNVGIGTQSPSQKLHVVGNILATGTITPSDARFKKDIQPIHNSLEKISQINGVTYYYRYTEFKDLGFTDKEQVGVIAQEVEKVLPQLVFTDDKGYKAVDYTKLVPLLIEGIKEQQKQIETSNDRVEKLEQQVAELKKIVEQLVRK